MKAWQKRAAAAERTYKSWTVHLGYETGRHTKIEFRGKDAQEKCNAWVKAKIAEGDLRWVSVFEPVPEYRNGRFVRERHVHKWSRQRGWRTLTVAQHKAEQSEKRAKGDAK